MQQVAGVDIAVVVDVGHQRAVAAGVEVVEGDPPVAVDVPEAGLVVGGDFRLVDPDVLVQVLVGVIGAGVDVGDDHGRAAAGDVPGVCYC